jgi:exodeoxyribonuclease VII large subunit
VVGPGLYAAVVPPIDRDAADAGGTLAAGPSAEPGVREGTSAETAVPVRTVSMRIGNWIGRLGSIWVEGEIAQLTKRGGGLAFLTLRDVDADISLNVTCSRRVLDAAEPPLAEGARIVVLARPNWYAPRGQLSMSATEIRPVGLGELLARIEQLKRMLAAEGLFAAERKVPLPFLPRCVGLISGRGAAAERDVVENARRRWPAVRFAIESTAVQGAQAVPGVVAALQRLDADSDVDVIVISRGGGSVEDLLPFSDEVLLRAVAAATTPVVSAIGHEQDSPLLDLVADVRASTPTDAARRIVPDVTHETEALARARASLRTALAGRLHRHRIDLEVVIRHPVMSSSDAFLHGQRDTIENLRTTAARAVRDRLDRERVATRHHTDRLRLLSPASTLSRGYAIVRTADGQVVRSPADVARDEPLDILVADGAFTARVAPDPPQDASTDA